MSGDWIGDLVLVYWLLVLALNVHERITVRRKRAAVDLGSPMISTQSETKSRRARAA